MGNKSSSLDLLTYEVGKHPGVYLLPPREIMIYDSLPKSVRGQIYDGGMYDLYGKFGMAFDSNSLIVKPIGQAEKDYE